MHKKAFTLIELLVVIAIIAILAAILFPVFAQAKAAAKKTNDLSNLKQDSLAMLMYASDVDDTILPFPYDSSSRSPKKIFWSDIMYPYINSKDLYNNPANTDLIYFNTDTYRVPGGANDAATSSSPGVYRVNYAVNEFLDKADFDGSVNDSNGNPLSYGATSATAVDRPAEIVYMGPGQQAWGWSSCQPSAPGSLTMNLVWDISTFESGWGYELWGHQNEKGGWNGGANFSFVDGHAKYAKAAFGNTAPGDAVQVGGGLYQGYFPKAITHASVSIDGTCSGDRGSLSY